MVRISFTSFDHLSFTTNLPPTSRLYFHPAQAQEKLEPHEAGDDEKDTWSWWKGRWWDWDSQEKRYIEVEQREKAGSFFVLRDLYFNDCRVVHLGSGTNPLLGAAGRMSPSRDHLC
eukprot:symbB.v1.2.035927.t1/scaffold4936.1/size32649/1